MSDPGANDGMRQSTNGLRLEPVQFLRVNGHKAAMWVVCCSGAGVRVQPLMVV